MLVNNAADRDLASDRHPGVDYEAALSQINVEPGAGRSSRASAVQIHFRPCTDRNTRRTRRAVSPCAASTRCTRRSSRTASFTRTRRSPTSRGAAREFGVVDSDGNLITFAERR